ncbi:MAG: CvpA family protein [Lachnospiraceae bacterium]|nr:CvpA family protein [Lachnospiraceae bacterium]
MDIVEFMQKHWLSLLVGAYLTGMALYGHYRGFLRLAVSMAALILSLGAVRVAMPPLTALLKEHTGIHQWMRESIKKAIDLEEISSNMKLPAEQRSIIEGTALPDPIKQVLVENNNEEIYRLLGVNGLVEYITAFLADRIINTLAFILLFLGINVGLHVLSHILNIIAHLPLLYGLNQIAGAVLGVVMALVYFWVVCLTLNLFVSTAWGSYLLNNIESVPWIAYLYHSNPISRMFMNVIWNLL